MLVATSILLFIFALLSPQPNYLIIFMLSNIFANAAPLFLVLLLFFG